MTGTGAKPEPEAEGWADDTASAEALPEVIETDIVVIAPPPRAPAALEAAAAEDVATTEEDIELAATTP